MRKFKRLNRKGFTLIELLAVIVILAVVMGVATTSVLSAMNNSRKTSLQNSAKTAADAFRVAYAEYSMSTSDTKAMLGLSHDDSVLLAGGTAVALTGTANSLNISANNYDLSKSYVYFEDGNFTVCLVASDTGSYYVAAAATTTTKTLGAQTVGDATNGLMWACNDDSKSW